MSTGQRKTKALVGVVGAMGALAAGATITANADSIQVKQGDTVWELSQKLGVSIDDLEAQNSIDSKTDLIFVGQKLQVRSAKTTQTHTVKSGDTLWDLAQQYHVSVAQLQKANHMTGDVLSVGQQLTIPRGSTAKTTTGVQANTTTGTTVVRRINLRKRPMPCRPKLWRNNKQRQASNNRDKAQPRVRQPLPVNPRPVRLLPALDQPVAV